ncbi:hypothetical protein TNCV_4671951 [Trichonephila clavipes]|nr:hypothetical protein TNCV_4671951 [Trichonephila clavipes]
MTLQLDHVFSAAASTMMFNGDNKKEAECCMLYDHWRKGIKLEHPEEHFSDVLRFMSMQDHTQPTQQRNC